VLGKLYDRLCWWLIEAINNKKKPDANVIDYKTDPDKVVIFAAGVLADHHFRCAAPFETVVIVSQNAISGQRYVIAICQEDYAQGLIRKDDGGELP
jgi:hypothetical protein